MAELIRVRFKNGTEATVGADWPRVWPEDIDSILEPKGSPRAVDSTPEPTPAQESTVAQVKEKK